MDADPSAGVGDVLAGKPADNQVRTISEQLDGERENVVPHRRRTEPSFLHTARQPEDVLDTVFHEEDRLNLVKDPFNGEVEGADAGEEADITAGGRWTHIGGLRAHGPGRGRNADRTAGVPSSSGSSVVSRRACSRR